MNLKYIESINKDLIKDGKVESFKEQIFDLISGHYNLSRMMVVSTDSKALTYIKGVEADKIITISPNKILKVMTEHDLSFYDISELDELLKESVMAMDSMTHESSRIVVLDKKDIKGDQMIAICRTDAKSGNILINRITSVYGKKNFEEFLNRTCNMGKNIYENKKTIEFCRTEGLQLPNRATNSISVNKYNTQMSGSQEEKEKNKEEFELGL